MSKYRASRRRKATKNITLMYFFPAFSLGVCVRKMCVCIVMEVHISSPWGGTTSVSWAGLHLFEQV